MANHFWLDFHLIELLARVDADNAADHLGHNDHVAQMCLDQVGLLVRLRFLLGLAQLLDEPERAALQAAIEPASGSCVDDIAELLGGEIKESEGACQQVIFAGEALSASVRCHRDRAGSQPTGQGRCLDRKTFGRLSSSSTLREVIVSAGSTIAGAIGPSVVALLQVKSRIYHR